MGVFTHKKLFTNLRKSVYGSKTQETVAGLLDMGIRTLRKIEKGEEVSLKYVQKALEGYGIPETAHPKYYTDSTDNPVGELINLPASSLHSHIKNKKLRNRYAAIVKDLSNATEKKRHLVGISGMSGIGKTALAYSLIHEKDIRENFCDGIIWISLGENDSHHSIVSGKRCVAEFGDAKAVNLIQYPNDGSIFLKNRLKNKKVLIVLDNLTDESTLSYFEFLDSGSSILYTTQDNRIIDNTYSLSLKVEFLNEDEARFLFANTSEIRVTELSSEATKVVEYCSGLPMALVLCGKMHSKGQVPFYEILKAFRENDLDFIQDSERSIKYCLDLSTGILSKLERKLFCDLTQIFAVPDREENTIIKIWNDGIDFQSRHSIQLLNRLEHLNLISCRGKTPNRIVSLHSLITSYLCSEISDIKSVHLRILDRLKNAAPKGLPEAVFNQDVYYVYFYCHHLVTASQYEELKKILTNFINVDILFRTNSMLLLAGLCKWKVNDPFLIAFGSLIVDFIRKNPNLAFDNLAKELTYLISPERTAFPEFEKLLSTIDIIDGLDFFEF